MELTEALVFISMLWWDLVGKSEEEELERLLRDEVEARILDFALTRLGFVDATEENVVFLHLLEPMHDRGMEFVFVGKMALEVAPGWERLRAKRAAVTPR
jgi:hypothetical protein